MTDLPQKPVPLTVFTSTTRVILLDHALALFLEGGLEAVGLREVARRTGVSATAVYRHFTDKQDLMRAVVAGGFDRFDGALADPHFRLIRSEDPSRPLTGLKS